MDQPPGSLPLWPIAGIGICVLFSALFSGTETALTALTPRLTRQLIERGGRGDRVLSAWLERPNRILSTLLVGNNVVNIAASVMSVHVAAWALALAGPSAAGYADAVAVVGMTVLLLVFAEVTPKTYAKHNAVKLAVPAILFVRLVEYPLLPAAWVLTGIARLVVRVLGGQTSQTGPVVTEEDIEYMIELGAREGVFEQEERADLLEAALEFGDTIAKEIMIPRTGALALDAETPVKEALEAVIKRGHSRVPVYRDSIDKVVGVLYVKDLLRAMGRQDIGETTIGGLARQVVFFVPETQKIADTLREMQRRRVHLGVVVDEFGGFSGIITVEDILEELVGEIRDEYDREEELVRQVDDATFLANAAVSIHDLGALLDVKFPDEGDYETLGGFVVAKAGRLPVAGEVIEWKGLAIEVVGADERHVERVRIRRRPVEPEPKATVEEPS